MTTTPVELPPPWDHCYVWNGPYGTRKFTVAKHNGRVCDDQVPVYTADQMRSYAASAVAAALQAQPAIPDEVKLALNDALLALSFCGKATQARALNAQAIRRIKSVLEKS
jgi:hypothetical protein